MPHPNPVRPAFNFARLRLSLVASAIAWVLALPATAQDDNPLAPVDTSSPRGTLYTFIAEMNEAVALYRDREDRDAARARVHDAVRCLDLSEVPPSIVETVGFETALRLKEVLDRISLPFPGNIPDAAAMQEDPTGVWTVPDTPIEIVRIAEGPRAGAYLFSSETVKRSEEFYDRVSHLPYKPQSGKGAHYAEYEVGAGEFLAGWVTRLPEWSKKKFHGQAVWQWAGLALCYAIAALLAALFYVGGQRLAGSRENLAAYVLPLALMGSSLLLEVVAVELHLTGGVYTTVALLFTGLFFVGGVRLVAVAMSQLANAVIAAARLRPHGVDSQLVRLGFRTLIITVTTALAFVAADQLGLPAYSVLTGLGIGGLAVALAARETLANFLASVVIMFERPFRLGDWIKVSGQEGTVEDVGFRSTRIRTFYNSVITIPSSEMVAASIDNMGMRQYRRVRTVLQITYDTASEKIEAFVEGIKEIIRNHPSTRKDNFHVVFHDFSAHSLNILVYLFLVAPDWATELKERQKVLLEIIRLAEELGVDFAFPTRTLHLESLPEAAAPLSESDDSGRPARYPASSRT